MTAPIRPDSVNLPLFLHVLGAMLLVGTLLTVTVAMQLSRGRAPDDTGLTRFALRTTLVALFPAYLLMRIGAQWTESEEDLPDAVTDQAWIGIGYITADLGALLVIASMVLSAVGLRKLANGGGQGQARAIGIIAILLLVAYLIAIWAMSAKPE